MLYFEDLPAGATRSFGHKLVTRDEVIAFAAEFDPQPMHLDEAAAAQSILGGLAASGWHSAAMLMRMICDEFLLNTASLGSPGLADLRWLKPVKPGDVLTARYTVKEARPSASKPGVGIVRMLYEVTNQSDNIVMTWDCTHLFGRRPEALSGAPQPAGGA
jgi:acyl dehydratase